jgi:lysyl-tRNA synthetase class 1
MDFLPSAALRSWPHRQAIDVLRHVVKTRLPSAALKDAMALLSQGRVEELITAFPALSGRQVTFQTGYGPSGAPHIGTFAEVVRTSWVQHAFRHLTGDRIKTALYVVSDDFDGFRKVPDGLPAWMEEDFGKPLTSVRDPDDIYESFGAANNAKLRAFLANLGIEHFFVSATRAYDSGVFNDELLNVFDHHDAILDIILPTLGEERRATYCAFMPLSQEGRLLQTGTRLSQDHRGLLLYDDRFGCQTGNVVTDGNAKLQWKVDWAMRWAALGTDYEMSGKDLIESVKIGNQIVRVLGSQPPVQMTYEMFLDENGEKISKSRGNGLSVEQWLRYGSREGLSYYMFGNPTAAKKLHVGVIPRAEDDYLEDLEAVTPDSPSWHIHRAAPPAPLTTETSYAMLVNMASVSRAPDPGILLQYLSQNRPIAEEEITRVHALAQSVVNYCAGEVYPHMKPRVATKMEKVALYELTYELEQMADGLTAEEYQTVVYEVGKTQGYADDLRAWFRVIYETVFGSEEGPRIGAFICAIGRLNAISLFNGVPMARDPFIGRNPTEVRAWEIAREAHGPDIPSPHEGMPPSVWCAFVAAAEKELGLSKEIGNA